MYYDDHNPPHFHVKYNEFRAKFSIADLQLLEGALPKKVTTLVVEWAFEHRPELLEDWDLASKKEPLKNIVPLV